MERQGRRGEYLVNMVSDKQRRIGPKKLCNACALVAGDEDADLLLCEGLLIYLDVVQEISVASDVATVCDSWKGVLCQPATGVA